MEICGQSFQTSKSLIHSIVYEDIGKSFVKKAAIRTKRGCRPAGRDADKWLGTIGSNQCDSSSLGLR